MGVLRVDLLRLLGNGGRVVTWPPLDETEQRVAYQMHFEATKNDGEIPPTFTNWLVVERLMVESFGNRYITFALNYIKTNLAKSGETQ